MWPLNLRYRRSVKINDIISTVRGTRIGIDVGTTRIGVARSDPDGIMALPLVTLYVGDQVMNEVLALIDEYLAQVIYVGNPVSLSGASTQSTVNAEEFALELSTHTDIPIFLIDERLSTKSASAQLRAAGKNAKNSKEIIDQAAAVIILETALASERNTGNRAGQRVSG